MKRQDAIGLEDCAPSMRRLPSGKMWEMALVSVVKIILGTRCIRRHILLRTGTYLPFLILASQPSETSSQRALPTRALSAQIGFVASKYEAWSLRPDAS